MRRGRQVHFARGTHAIVVGRGTLELSLARIAESTKRGVEAAANELCQAVKDYAPKKTGRLASEIYVGKIIELVDGHWRIEIIAPTPYAAAQERGSGVYAELRPGIVRRMIPILPKEKGGILTFRWPDAPARFTSRYAGIVYLPMVVQLGVRPTRFMRRALRDNTTRIWTRILEASARPR